MAAPALDELLRPWRADPARSAILTDFDGTLAPIVSDPLAARPLAGAVDVLRQLAARYAVVAVISGRPVTFLLDRFGDTGSVILSGLYGLEWIGPGGHRREHPGAAPWRPIVAGAADEAEANAPPGVFVERKGLSVTIHVRTAPERDEWAREWVTTKASETGLAVHPARRSYELRPPVAADKASAVTELVGALDAACFMGDDLGDLPAFDALDRLAAARGLITARIGVESSEAPSELLARADALVAGPEGALAVLHSLLDVE
ncbi:MAG: trehalose 6-phosphate phosphatase [Actinomycetota bacterium]|jgi:trehalose 6-phosphate phosphatase|nr:trehalose 6-phosphate phosphatase [Actinomycetota bacterium]